MKKKISNFIKYYILFPKLPEGLSYEEQKKWHKDFLQKLNKQTRVMRKISRITDVVYSILTFVTAVHYFLQGEYTIVLWISIAGFWFGLYRMSQYIDDQHKDRMDAMIASYRDLTDDLFERLKKAVDEMNQLFMLLQKNTATTKKKKEVVS